jgi:hypothetical protein
MSNRHERVVDLLERWSELSRQGQPVSASELCADCPDLIGDLERHIRFLSGLDHLVVPQRAVDETVWPESQTSTTTTAWGEGRPAPAEAGSALPVVPNHDILGLLGSGGMGAVYRARDRRLDRVVALKVIREGLAGPAQLSRFQVEAEAVARLNHPHVVQIYEVGRWRPPDGGLLPYLSLEYVEGDTLEKRLGRQPADPTESARLLRLLARAVQAAHRKGIIHRDLKPGNVLLAAAADEPALNCAWGWPKLTDFGLARRQASPGSQPGEAGLTHTGAVLGTPGYMAPEQADGRSDVGPAADVYGLGAILYRMLTGRPPFVGKSAVDTMFSVLHEIPLPPRQVRSAVPVALDALCVRCLDKVPARRPDVAELIEALDGFLAGDPTGTVTWQPASEPRVPAGPDQSRWTRRRVLAAGLVGLALLAAGGLAWALWPRAEGEDAPPVVQRAPPVAPTPEPPLRVRSLRVMHHAVTPDGKKSEPRGAIGEKSFRTRFGDQVTITVELSSPGYFYLVALNADGKEQLLWPTDDRNEPLVATAPAKRKRLVFPRGGKQFTLNDERRGGMQAFLVLASRQPLPAYEKWTQAGRIAWGRREPGAAVWQADDRGVYELGAGQGAVRGSVEPLRGAPPLDELCKALRVGGVEVVEAIAFGVRAQESE